MENSFFKRQKARRRRVLRSREKLKGDGKKPRMSIYKSNRHLYIQIVDDEAGRTLVSASTMKKGGKQKSSMSSAEALGKEIAKLALEKGVEKIVFDRGRFKYHGLIAKIAESARQTGLKF